MNEARKTDELQENCATKTSSTRNKVRNNKVYTTKGPRDRRIRLSADIAIQFYDVQDRLGYERASEVVDWLISKAKGSIDKLVDNSSLQQQFEHLTNSGAQNNVYNHHYYQNDYVAENMSDSILSRTDVGLSFLQGGSTREDYRVSDFNNFSIDTSTLSPCIQMANQQCLEHSSNMYPVQQIDENGGIPRMIMFNSKMNSRIEEHSFMPNYVPLISSSVDTPTSDPKLNLCLPSNSTSAFSDSEQWTFF